MIASYPANWYWRAEDGRVYSSAAQDLVDAADPAYVEWATDGNTPTIWPRDDAGQQTDDALRAVLAPWGLFFFSPAEAQVAAVRARTQAAVAAGAPIDGLHVEMSPGARADMGAMATAAIAALVASVPWDPNYARGWITLEGSRIPLATPNDGLGLASRVGAFYAAVVQHGQDLENDILAAADPLSVDITEGWPTEA